MVSPESNFTAEVTILCNEFVKYTFAIAVTPPRGQWVKSRTTGNVLLELFPENGVLGANHAVFSIIRSVMSCSITQWNKTFCDGSMLCHAIYSKVVFANIHFHQTQPVNTYRKYGTWPTLKNKFLYSICFVSIIKIKKAFFNRSIEITSHNMYTVAGDTTPRTFLKLSRDYRKVFNIRRTKSQKMFLVSSCSCLYPIRWSQV